MNICIKMEGFVEEIIDEAVHKGVAKTKSEALRIAVLELNNKFRLVPEGMTNEEMEDFRLARQLDSRVKNGKDKVVRGKKALKKLLIGD